MIRIGGATVLGVLMVLALVRPGLAQTHRFTIIAQGKTVGAVSVRLKGAAEEDDYQYRNNGRGPTLHERMEVGAGGIPTHLTIDGTTAFGGAVHEIFAVDHGRASWTSQADSGSAAATGPRLYVANDGTPWSTAVYARALLARPDRRLEVLPSGTLHLETLRRATLNSHGRVVPVTAYALEGIDLAPRLLLLNAKKELVAEYHQDPGNSPVVVVRQGMEDQYGALQALSKSLVMDQERALQAKLAHKFDAPIRIRNVRIFDPKAEELTGPSQVVVFRGRITQVQPEDSSQPTPPDEVQIDGQGGALIAGLHDMHSHTTYQSGPLYLAAGVTTTRDMGNDNLMLLDLVKRLDSGEMPGPRIVRSGLLEGISPYSASMGLLPPTLGDALADVDRYADRGYWQIKIYNSMTPSWVKPIAAEAHRRGLRVAGHIPAFMTADQAVEDGYDELTHANLLMLSWLLDTTREDTRTPLRITALGRAANLDFDSPKVQATLALMREHHTAFDPTAVIIERLMLSRAGVVSEADRPYLDHMPIGYQRFRKRSFVNFKSPAEDEAFKKGFDKVLELIRILDRQGTKILPGTDDPSGFTLHRELELYVKAGLAPGKVLRMATYDDDVYLGRGQDFGSIEKDKAADLILVAGDPTRNISDIRQVRMTMKGGTIYFPAEIYQALSIKPFAAPPPVRPASAGAEAVMGGRGAGTVSSGLAQGLDDEPQ